jgi:hypothetical protein
MISRGVTAEQLKIMDVCWRGPFLACAISAELAPEHTPPVDAFPPEGKGSANHILSAVVPRKLVDSTKYSSYWKLLRVTAWILRFSEIALRRERYSGNLTALELEAARSYWIQAVQVECFAAELRHYERTCHSQMARR